MSMTLSQSGEKLWRLTTLKIYHCEPFSSLDGSTGLHSSTAAPLTVLWANTLSVAAQHEPEQRFVLKGAPGYRPSCTLFNVLEGNLNIFWASVWSVVTKTKRGQDFWGQMYEDKTPQSTLPSSVMFGAAKQLFSFHIIPQCRSDLITWSPSQSSNVMLKSEASR